MCIFNSFCFISQNFQKFRITSVAEKNILFYSAALRGLFFVVKRNLFDWHVGWLVVKVVRLIDSNWKGRTLSHLL